MNQRRSGNFSRESTSCSMKTQKWAIPSPSHRGRVERQRDAMRRLVAKQLAVAAITVGILTERVTVAPAGIARYVGQWQHFDMLFKAFRLGGWLPKDANEYPIYTHISFGLVLSDEENDFGVTAEKML
ncbi:hypothetical protein TSUD_142140 [Trifolium subterraneum]|uniref:Uncharacterized protein n=1 Tax=Trifolium subterraneum TaxID=3900 RepID=A0A2Z6MI01_TRISU|nr:hypothetical protein TSUD_142140 [Trifolium subterraneum]